MSGSSGLFYHCALLPLLSFMYGKVFQATIYNVNVHFDLFRFDGKMRLLKMGFCVSHDREALVLASIHICISGNCVEMVRWTFSVDVNDMHYIFHPVRGLFSTMNCAYLHLAGGCCAHNVVVVHLKSQNVTTIPALKYCAFIKYFENPVNTWMKRMK